jgi:hypothetical protein
MKPRYLIEVDQTNTDALAVVDTETSKVVERGIKADGGRTAWAIARELRDRLNADAEAA